ncbi:MAG: NfeD family protein [Verrucomicrobiota bacterium]
MPEIVGLLLLALVLASLEVLVPGGILGIFAAVALALASYLSYEPLGLAGAVLVFIVGGSAILTAVYFEFKLLGKTRLRKNLILGSAVTGRTESVSATDEVIGIEGVTLTTMAPTGMIRLGEDKFEAYSRSGLLEKGQAIRVVARDNFRLTVEKL